MYVGRIVAAARTRAGANAVLYRVSSRSYPSRRAAAGEGRVAIVPKPGHEADAQDNPYVTYNCVRIASAPGGPVAVAANGSHSDPIAEKIGAGVPARDALAQTLLALDFERDAYSTPRIAAVVPLRGDPAWLATVRADALVVRAVELQAGRAAYLATYERHDIDPGQVFEFDAADAASAARYAIDGSGFAELERPVTAAAALAGAGGFDLGVCDAG